MVKINNIRIKKLTKNDILNAIVDSEICLKELEAILIVPIDEIKQTINDYSLSTNIYIDGGARGNPGESGIGIVIDKNNKKTGYYFYTGHSTNNEAEYKALIEALNIAKKLSFENVNIFSDSELVCNQINGIYKVKSESLLTLNIMAKQLIDNFKTFKICHIPREQNSLADKMVNLAIDQKKDGLVELTTAK